MSETTNFHRGENPPSRQCNRMLCILSTLSPFFRRPPTAVAQKRWTFAQKAWAFAQNLPCFSKKCAAFLGEMLCAREKWWQRSLKPAHLQRNAHLYPLLFPSSDRSHTSWQRNPSARALKPTRSNEREGIWAAFVSQPTEGRAHFHIENQDFTVKPEPIGKKREPNLLTCEKD